MKKELWLCGGSLPILSYLGNGSDEGSVGQNWNFYLQRLQLSRIFQTRNTYYNRKNTIGYRITIYRNAKSCIDTNGDKTSQELRMLPLAFIINQNCLKIFIRTKCLWRDSCLMPDSPTLSFPPSSPPSSEMGSKFREAIVYLEWGLIWNYLFLFFIKAWRKNIKQHSVLKIKPKT